MITFVAQELVTWAVLGLYLSILEYIFVNLLSLATGHGYVPFVKRVSFKSFIPKGDIYKETDDYGIFYSDISDDYENGSKFRRKSRFDV